MLERLLALLSSLLAMGENALEQCAEQTNLGGFLFLVNRDFTLPPDYRPPDLVMPGVRKSSDSVLLRSEAAAALEEMFAAASEEAGCRLVAVSGFRSYSTQNTIFARKVSRVGRERALLLVAPPGCSEHQLGLAMDLGTMKTTSLTEAFAESPEGRWVAENAWRFGFIIRYKAEWTQVTGYSWEPWHVRFVGREHARALYEANVPFELYIQSLREARLAAALEGR